VTTRFEAGCTDGGVVGVCAVPVARPQAARRSDPPIANAAMAGRRRPVATRAAYGYRPEIGGVSEDNLAVYDAAAWHDYFLMVGGGAAALTGLVFVAMSIHLDSIALNAAHRHRARTVLTGLTAVFIRCALVLMAGQSAQAVALELIIVLIGVEVVLYRSIRRALEATRTGDPALLWRTIGSFSCLVIEQAGAVVLFLGNTWGLYVVGVGMMSSFIFMVTGAWLLIVGVRREEAAQTAM